MEREKWGRRLIYSWESWSDEKLFIRFLSNEFESWIHDHMFLSLCGLFTQRWQVARSIINNSILGMKGSFRSARQEVLASKPASSANITSNAVCSRNSSLQLEQDKSSFSHINEFQNENRGGTILSDIRDIVCLLRYVKGIVWKMSNTYHEHNSFVPLRYYGTSFIKDVTY